jgi:hypothetical protein
MIFFKDIYERKVRLSDERYAHLLSDHPDMEGQMDKVQETLLIPEKVVRSRTDSQVELFNLHYKSTPVTQKYMCVVVKAPASDAFIITAYFTDVIKKGEIL